MSYDEAVQRICPRCSVAIMEPHPTLNNWYKCQVCGFSKEIPKEINPLHKILNSSKKKD